MLAYKVIKSKRSIFASLPQDIHPTIGIPLNKCYLNLLRRTVAGVLANQGFIIREILVNKGKEIALVITLPEENVKIEASCLGINKAVEFGVSDLLSLEPVDSHGRPLRLNQCIYDESVWNENYKEIGRAHV